MKYISFLQKIMLFYFEKVFFLTKKVYFGKKMLFFGMFLPINCIKKNDNIDV